MTSSYSLVMSRTDRSEKILSTIDNEDDYKQLYSSVELCGSQFDWSSVKSLVQNRFHFYVILLLIFTSQTESFPLPFQGRYQPFSPSLSSSTMPTSLTSTLARPWLNTPVYLNGGSVQIHHSHPYNTFRRERHRRVMIDRLMILFDEDGNGELSKDELYSLSLRFNIFPRFHRYLKQISDNPS